MIIWHNPGLKVEDLFPLGINTMTEALGIEWVELGPDFIKARMPVDNRTRQPHGFMHGGASCVLAETIGSVGSAMVINPEIFFCMGIEINANHIRGVREGYVTGTASPLHLGSTTHVWDIKIHNEEKKLICVSRLTVAILSRSK